MSFQDFGGLGVEKAIVLNVSRDFRSDVGNEKLESGVLHRCCTGATPVLHRCHHSPRDPLRTAPHMVSPDFCAERFSNALQRVAIDSNVSLCAGMRWKQRVITALKCVGSSANQCIG